MRKVIKLYGMQGTGTNWAKAMMEDSFNALVLSHGLGAMHELPVEYSRWCEDSTSPFVDEIFRALMLEQVFLVVVVKDPIAAAWAYWQQNENFETFPKMRFSVMQTYITRANLRYRQWKLQPYPKVFVKYEDLLISPHVALRGIAEDFGIPLLSYKIHDISGVVGPTGERTNKPHDRDFWIDRQWTSEIKTTEFATLQQGVDWKLYRGLGYVQSS